MLKRLNQTLSKLIDHELRTAQLLFLFLSVGFTAFTLFGDNLPVKGPLKHEWLNGIDALAATVILLGLLFLKPIQIRYQQCAYVFMYVMNFVNIYLLYGTSFHIQYAYQFIVAYTISGWFFRDKRNWLIHTAVMNFLLIFVILIAEKNTASSFDFYATYIVASFAQAILIHFRFSIEEKLSVSEKMYRLLAENSFDLICIHNADGSLEFVSPSIKRLLGYEPTELVGRKPYEFIHTDDRDIIRSLNLSKPNHPSIQHPSQYRLQHKNGSSVWVETIFIALEETDGVKGTVLSQSRDIRRSKAIQLQLEERTKELERSNADLETFAFVSSHDMQEPLRMISNYMQLLKKRYHGQLDKDADEYIEYANKGAVHLQQLIRDLLSYSRITRTELTRVSVNMNAAIDEVIKNIQIEIKEKNATVAREDLCSVEVDRNLLLLVIQNLILNGIKYNHSSNPEIKISCTKHDKETIFCFTDNGIGIKPEYQQRIFEPFHRLHTKAEISGTGLGLSISKKIIERLGGKIWMESEFEKGSKFFFSLPNS